MRVGMRLPSLSETGRRKPRSGPLHRVYRQFERGEQAGAVVVQHELAIVQVSDRLGECEAETRALVGTARIQPPEAPPRLVAAVARNSRAAIGDLDRDLAIALIDADADLAA